MGLFLLVDCNNFFVSCERLFQPSLEGRAVIVLSNNDGCVVSRSEEAKKMGIAMGVPFFQIKEFCQVHNVAVFSSNFQLYGEISQRIMELLANMGGEIEVYSIDEAFLYYPSSVSWEKVLALGREIECKILRWVGIPVSVGLAPTKTLAKIAAKKAKRDPQKAPFDLHDRELQDTVLATFPVAEIWGVGYKSEQKLHAIGIYTAQELRDENPIKVRGMLGVMGERMVWELRGKNCFSQEERESTKSITCSRSFGKIVTKIRELEAALSTHVATACEKLRRSESLCQLLYVYLEFLSEEGDGFRQSIGKEISLPLPSNDTPEMIHAAKMCLQELFCEKKRYKKCGVILMDFIAEKNEQADLFLKRDQKRRLLAKTVDDLNNRYGKNTLFYGAMIVSSSWKMRANLRSKNSASSWKELAIVKA